MLTKTGLLFFWILLATSPFVAAADEIETFANSEIWLRSLFYVKSGEHWRSRVTTNGFFAAGERGKTDPTLELQTDIEIFRKGPHGETGPEAPQCRFAYRYKLLKDRFHLPEWPECAELTAWLDKYKPTGISIVYASQYMANPSSAFGHSFLITTSKQQVEALWQTFNYAAAMPDGISAFKYAWGGITGWYTGDFSNMPFYQRLYFYGNVENRDLWIYPIRLSEAQVDLMIRMLWDMVNNAKFYYFFLDENCAGELMRTFAAVFPEIPFDGHLPAYVHPVEVIRFLDHYGKVGEPSLMPSQFSELRQKYLKLSSVERSHFREAVDHPDRDVKLDNIPLAEAIMEYTNYQYRANAGQTPAEYEGLEKRAYIQRAHLGQSHEAPVLPADVSIRAPHLAHDSMSADIGSSIVNGQGTMDLSWRAALHSALDPDAGFMKNSTFEFLKLTMSTDFKRFWLKDFTLINLENFQTLWLEIPKPSWKVNLHIIENLLSSKDLPASDYLEAKFSAGGSYVSGNHLLYGMIAVALNGGPGVVQGHYNIGPEIGYRWTGQKFRLYAYGNPLISLFEVKPYWWIDWGVGEAVSLNSHFELLHETKSIEIFDGSKVGYRSTLSLRSYF